MPQSQLSSFVDRRAFLAALAGVGPLTFLVSGLAGGSARAEAPATSGALSAADAATAFLASLSAEQREKATIAFDSEERENWHYVPKERKGIPIKELSAEQLKAGLALLDSVMSAAGGQKARRILDLEEILAIVENNPTFRDRGAYYFSVFGPPGEAAGWGWRFEGHHISINYTDVNGAVSVTPAFWGANPADVRDRSFKGHFEDEYKGIRTLAGEEDTARRLALSLQESGKTVVVKPEAPSEYYSRAARKVSPLEESGVPCAEMTPEQQEMLKAVLRVYAGNFSESIAAQELGRVEKAGWEKVRFSWEGGLKPGEKHYYRLQGPTFLLEFVNVQNDANHIHSAWRSFEGDFGRELKA